MGVQSNLIQDVTHWEATPDGYGGYTFGTPAALKARWEDKAVLFRTPGGEEEVSQSVVYLSADVSTTDYLFLGTSTAIDPTTVSGAHQVKQFFKTPDLRRLEFERKAML